MSFIWHDKRPTEPHDMEGQAIAILAMSFFLVCLVLAGLVAFLARG